MKENMEVIHSLISTHSLESYLKLYDIGEIKEFRFLTRGLNDSYLVVTEKEKYIFRIYRSGWRDYSDILYELEAINHISSKGISVSVPIKNNKGSLTNQMIAPEGVRYGVLFTFAEGKIPKIEEENCSLIGRALALIHEATSSFAVGFERRNRIDIEQLLEEPLKFIIPIIKKELGDEAENFLYNFAEGLKKRLPLEDLEMGFCHGDFHDWNMHQEDKNLTIFDFDCCGFGYRAYDISVFLWNLKNNYKNLEEVNWMAFLKGYESIRDLSKQELEAVAIFVSVRRIWLMGIYLSNPDVWGTNWINEGNLNHFINSLKLDIN